MKLLTDWGWHGGKVFFQNKEQQRAFMNSHFRGPAKLEDMEKTIQISIPAFQNCIEPRDKYSSI